MRVYRIAERNIGIESLHEQVHALCSDYLTDGIPDFTVHIDQKDIDREKELSAREDRLEGRLVRTWNEEYLEELAVYRKIAEIMPCYNTILFHGSAVAVDGEGYLFSAESGTGKSTHAQLWRELLGSRFTYVNDDKPLIRIAPEKILVFGTPYDGKHHRSANISVPLKAICFLKRGERNTIREIGTRDAFPLLMQQVYYPQNKESLKKTIALLNQLLEQVKFYQLFCNKDQEAAHIAFEGMGGTLK